MVRFNFTKPIAGLAVAAAALMTSALVVGCDAGAQGGYSDERGRGDVPVGSRDYGRPHVVNNANGFGNVSIKCDGKYGYMIFMPTHDLSDVPPVVVPDPRCPGYRPDLHTPSQPTSAGKRPPDDE